MFFSDAPSPYDLNFRLLGFPVRVQPWFWIVMAVLGADLLQTGRPELLLIWIACGFVLILVHELGHALAYRMFGSWAAITLTGFGGLAQGSSAPREAWQRLFVSAAGPLAGFAFVGAVFVSDVSLGWSNRGLYSMAAYHFMMLMGIFWNVLNLLPIYPLDGGNIAREIFVMLRLRNPDMLKHQVSVGVAGVLAIYGIASLMNIPMPAIDKLTFGYRPSLYMTIWFGLFAYQNYQMLQIYKQHRSFYDRDDDSPPWRR